MTEAQMSKLFFFSLKILCGGGSLIKGVTLVACVAGAGFGMAKGEI